MKVLKTIWLLALVLPGLNTQAMSGLFEADLDAIEAQFPSEGELKLVIEETWTDEDHLSIELPTEPSDNRDLMPIMGIPTFIVTFVPTCAVGCMGSPCAGCLLGSISVGYIYYFTDDRDESRKALLGAATGLCLPILGWAAFVAADPFWIF